MHLLLKFNVNILKFLRSHDFFKVWFFDSDVRNTNHDVFAMEIDAEKATTSEFDVEAADSTAGFEEVPGINEKMEGY